ncbi:MAG: CoA transferase [Mycolicibacterium sp.]|nr:CoA transferase [Mycolicibacterium sp.]
MGPLDGVRVLELGGIGPGPFAAMLLADMGADVVRVDRPGEVPLFPGRPEQNLLHRNKRSVALNLRDDEGGRTARALADEAHVVIEGFRPGTAERLGVGPQDLWETNPALVYGRMTGWGQDGPRAMTAGHDINYVAVTGALHAIGEAGGPPQIPVNLLGDFGGGGAYLVIGVLAALREAGETGRGQVVDAAIVDGVSHLLAGTHARIASGTWVDERGVNLLDGGAPFYAVYETSDGQHMAAGAIENKFYTEMLSLLDLDDAPETQNDRSTWPGLRQRIAQRFASQTQAHWCQIFEKTDACVSPVRSMHGALEDPQIASRGSVFVAEQLQPGRAPRFPSYANTPIKAAPWPGANTDEVLAEWLTSPRTVTTN